jgi:hypothetical protein
LSSLDSKAAILMNNHSSQDGTIKDLEDLNLKNNGFVETKEEPHIYLPEQKKEES